MTSPTTHSNDEGHADSAGGGTAADDGRDGGWNRFVLGAIGVAVVAGFLLFAALSGGDGPDASESGAVDSAIAQLAFTTEDGSTATLTEFAGEPLVVNFFASWCAPCRAEMPEFEEVHLARESDVKFLGVSHDLDETSWRGFVDETAITFETVFQPEQGIWEELDAKGMPATAFVSADGEVQHLFTGVLNQELLNELIDEHLLGDAQ